MPQFSDKLGRQWSIEFTFADVARVKREAGVNLLNVFQEGDATLQTLESDPATLLDVLVSAVRPQLADRGLTADDFAAGLLEEHVVAATGALLGALGDYFPLARRAALTRVTDAAINVARKTRERGDQGLTDWVQRTSQADLEQEIERRLRSMSGGSTSTSPPSPASNPGT